MITIQVKSLIQTDVCRFCLRNGADILIFDSTFLLSKMSDCNIVVLKDDGLPDKICTNCHIKLDDAAKFLNQCHENEKILRGHYDFEITNPHLNKENDHYNDCNANDFNANDFNANDCDANDCNVNDCNVNDCNANDCNANDCNANDCNANDCNANECNANDCISFDNVDYLDYNRTYVRKADEKRLMESIVISENGEEYMYMDGVKVIVNRSEMLRNGKVELRKKQRKKRLAIPKKKNDMLCPVCGKTFVKALSAHIKLHGERIFSCEICDKSFPIRKKLTQHMIVHSNVREHKCDYCEKCFKTACDKRKHIKALHREPLVLHPCIVCKKVFKKQRGLMEHMKVHTCEKSHECDVCHKKFAYKLTLTIHMRIHTGERPYVCSYCSKSFSAGQTLREHVRIHTGETPYDCPVCKKAFMQLSNMKSHFRNNHKGMEFKRNNIVKTYTLRNC